MGPKVYQLLDSRRVLWTTIDVVRFIKVGEGEAIGTVVLWIGVTSEIVQGEEGRTSERVPRNS